MRAARGMAHVGRPDRYAACDFPIVLAVRLRISGERKRSTGMIFKKEGAEGPSSNPWGQRRESSDDIERWAPPTGRTSTLLRIVLSTGASTPGVLTARGRTAAKVLHLGPYEDHYADAAQLLPRLLAEIVIPGDDLSWNRLGDAGLVQGLKASVWDVPACSLVVVLEFAIASEVVREIIAVMEDVRYGDVTRNDSTLLSDLDLSEFGEFKGDLLDKSSITHRLIMLPERAARPGWDDVQRLIYKADLPAIKEHCRIVYPHELNRRENALAAVGTEGSVLWGQEQWIENAVTVSAIQLMGSGSKVREIHRRAYEESGRFDSSDSILLTANMRRTERRRIISTAREVSDIEAQLTFGVEATQNLSLIVPSARVDTFHRHLYASLDLLSQAGVDSHMLGRLRAAIESRVLEIDTYEAQLAADRRRPFDWSVALLTLLVVSPTLIFSFLGSNVSEVPVGVSIFDSRLQYWLLGLGLVPVFVLLAVWFGWWLARRSHRGED
jgi:hypothetical protein